MALFSEITKQLKDKEKAKAEKAAKSVKAGKASKAGKGGKAAKAPAKKAPSRTASKIASYKENKVITAFQLVDLTDIHPDPTQPRKVRDTKSADLKAMAETIKSKGVLEPLLVQKADEGFRLIAGERRYWSSQLAGIKQVPVRVVSYNEREIAEIQLIENIQRKDLNPLERARGLKNIMDKSGATVEETYKNVGISRSLYYALMSLLNLPEDIQVQVDESYSSEGGGIALRELIELAKLKHEPAIREAFEALGQGESLIEVRQASADSESAARDGKKGNKQGSPVKKDKAGAAATVIKQGSTQQGVELTLSIPKGLDTEEIDLESLDALFQKLLNDL